MASKFRCVIHGSFSKNFEQIRQAAAVFEAAGIDVLAPKRAELVHSDDGFMLFEDEQGQDPRMVELMYLQNLKLLGSNGFSYYVCPEGYIGKSASYELGIAQLTNARCFFSDAIKDHPAYVHGNAVWSAESLANFIINNNSLPLPQVRRNERQIHELWESLMVPGSVVATGAIIEHHSTKDHKEKEILLVKTHKWDGRYSIVGGKVRRNERLNEALLREVYEETGLTGKVGAHICTFDQIKNSGYYRPGVQHIFVDNIVSVQTKKVQLNYEAQDYMWALPTEALQHLEIEPNARTTVEMYVRQLQTS